MVHVPCTMGIVFFFFSVATARWRPARIWVSAPSPLTATSLSRMRPLPCLLFQYKEFVCVEAGFVADKAKLEAGAKWQGGQILEVQRHR